MLDDIQAEVGRIAVPTLVLSGERDQVDPTAVLQQRVLPRIPGARLEVLPGVGHPSMLEAAEAVAGAIQRFVSNSRAR